MWKGCHDILFMEMKRLFVYITLTFIMANYTAYGVAFEGVGVAELTWTGCVIIFLFSDVQGK